MSISDFFKNAFKDMNESAKAQHEVDKANFEPVKTEAKAQWEETKSMGKSETYKTAIQAECDKQIANAKARTAAAQERINAVKDLKN